MSRTRRISLFLMQGLFALGILSGCKTSVPITPSIPQPTPVSSTNTATPTRTPTLVLTATPTSTPTNVPMTSTSTATATSTPTQSFTHSPTATFTATFTSTPTHGRVVATYAGNPTGGTSNGVGTAASFYRPQAVALDGSGNVYVADTDNHLIRKISSGGVVTTLAGTAGTHGSVDGVGSSALFYAPLGIAATSAGVVYVADTQNGLIRKISVTGSVTTFAGTAGSFGSVDGVGTAASFYAPSGVAVDAAGNVYVADEGNNKIRKITSSGVVSTLAGSGSAGSSDGTGAAASFWHPNSVAVDASSNVYVSDTGNHLIRKITSGGVVTTLAGTAGVYGSADGNGTSASFFSPVGIAVDVSGNLYVADMGNNKIRQVTPAGVVCTWAGDGSYWYTNGPVDTASFMSPAGVAVNASGVVYVADNGSNMIRDIQ